jgi:hypothetical protein
LCYSPLDSGGRVALEEYLAESTIPHAKNSSDSPSSATRCHQQAANRLPETTTSRPVQRRYHRRPAKLSQIAYVLGWIGYRGVISAAVLTALFVAAVRPPASIWVPTWAVLTLLLMMLDMRQTLPGWFAWFRGRPPQTPQKPSN